MIIWNISLLTVKIHREHELVEKVKRHASLLKEDQRIIIKPSRFKVPSDHH